MAASAGRTYDVAVVGLGAMGSATLFHLAWRGKSVVGIEQFTPGHDRGSSHGESRAIRLGYSEHPSYVPLVRRAFENWRALERLSGKTLLTTTGILEAGKPGSMMVGGSLDACLTRHLEHEALDATEINRRFPAIHLPNDYSGIWQPEGGFVHADRANAVHVKLARDRGAVVLERTRVMAIEPGPHSVSLRCGEQTVAARSVVIAAGPWATDLVPELSPRLRLQRQVLCWYRPAHPRGLGVGALPVFMIDGEDDLIYGFPDFDGHGLKCGSHYGSGALERAEDARQDAGPADEERTRRFLDRYLPGAAGSLKEMRTCIYTMTPDEDFIIDRLPQDERMVVLSPCSGHGFKFASVIGEVAADLAIGLVPYADISRFKLARFA